MNRDGLYPFKVYSCLECPLLRALQIRFSATVFVAKVLMQARKRKSMPSGLFDSSIADIAEEQ